MPIKRNGSLKRLRAFDEGADRVVQKKRPAPAKGPSVERKWLPPAFIAVLSFALHFAWLDHPRSVVFDEVHFGKFATAYCCTQERFFDAHPPHGKLLLAAAAKVAGYDGGLTFERIGQPYGKVSPWSLRWFPALMGALIPLLAWFVMRQLGASRPASFLVGLALGLDNALTTQSRMVALDSMLIAFSLSALALFLHALKRSTRRRWIWLSSSGILLGMAAGTKVTGAAMGVLMAVVLFHPFFSRRGWDTFRFGARGLAIVLTPAIAVFYAGFFLHFAVLTKPGSADKFFKPTDSAWQNVTAYQSLMFEKNYTLAQTHPAQSRWWEWPMDRKPIYYWAEGDRGIFLWGNPALWWGTSLLMLFTLGAALLGRITSLKIVAGDSRSRALQWIPLWGFVLSYLPLIFVPRVLFLYHYLTPLVFATMYVVLWLDGAGWIPSSRLRRQKKSFYVVVGLLLAGFLAVAPATFGWKIIPEWNQALTSLLAGIR